MYGELKEVKFLGLKIVSAPSTITVIYLSQHPAYLTTIFNDKDIFVKINNFYLAYEDKHVRNVLQLLGACH